MKISPKRILYLDEVRSLAIILVVLGHIIRMFSKDFASWQICSGVFSLTRIGVPLFFTVSGALLLTRKHDIKQFLEKRFKRVFLPFAFWIIVYMVLGVVIWQYPPTLQYAYDITFGIHPLCELFWFIWSLIGVYVLIPVLSSFIREYGDFGSKYLIIITVLLSLLVSIGFFNDQHIKHDFRVIFNFFPVLGYFILGSYIHNHEFKYSKNRMFLIGVIMFVIGIIGHFLKIYYKGLGGTALTPIDLFDIVVVMETVGVFIAFKYADVKMISDKLKPIREQRLGEIIVTFSSCSFGIYFSHYILMLYLFYKGFMKGWGYNNLFIYFPLSAVIIIVSCWILIYAMSKIPILKIGSGVK
ncbi:acyltransferase [Methanobrevibacter sp.]